MNKIEVNTIEIGGLAAMVQALHLPFGGKVKSENYAGMGYVDNLNLCALEFCYDASVTFADADIKLLQKLIKTGDEHAKVLRGVVVWAEINAPRYWWVEMDTYRIGSERLSSESTMHIDCKGLNTEELIKYKAEIKEGKMQKRVQYFSYQTLRRIYKQRRNHRLPHWHEFCEWIEKLPYADELITIGIKE